MNIEQAKKFINKYKILELISGSHLYGTNVETSDLDKIGIFIAPPEYYLGLDKITEIDMSVISKLENGKNDSNAQDIKYYELRTFVNLLKDNSPNAIELLFVNEENILFCNELGRRLLDNKHLFPYKGLSNRFIGYGKSQLHKANIKIDNYSLLNETKKWLDKHLVNPREQDTKEGQYYSNQLLAELRTNTEINNIIKFHEHHASIGDINISLTDKLTKVLTKVKERLSKTGNREELYTKYGQDTKFLAHAVRLLMEGKELLTTGEIKFPLSYKDMLLDIRNGLWTQQQCIDTAESLIEELDLIVSKSMLPDTPRHHEINKLLIDMIKESWRINESI